MRVTPHALLWLSVLVSPAARAAESAPTLNLDQALASVEKVNVTVLLSREAAAQSLELTSQLRAGILPIVSGSLNQRRSQGVSTAGVAVSSAPASRFDALLSGSYSLLDFNRRSAVKASRVGVEVAQANYSAVVQNILTSVAQTYFTHLRNLRRLDVFDANISRARSLLELAKNQLAAGVATQIDVTRADSVLALADQARLQQVTVLYQSELLLKRLLDVDTGVEMRLADFSVKRLPASMFAFGEQKTAFETRADYLASMKSLEQTKGDVRTAAFERLPILALTGTYGLASAKFDDSSKKDTWSTGVGLSFPIFDGFRAGADKRVALSRQRAQEARLHSLELQITAEIRLALQDAGSRNAQIAVAEKAVRLAQEEQRLARQRYQQGVADNREVVESENRLAIANDNLVEAVYQYNLSRVELARARGDVRNVLSEKMP
ncbi:MAG: TolC family protein [Opitutus sp.]|nr:TolC family protein [Opitutus sp.]